MVYGSVDENTGSTAQRTCLAAPAPRPIVSHGVGPFSCQCGMHAIFIALVASAPAMLLPGIVLQNTDCLPGGSGSSMHNCTQLSNKLAAVLLVWHALFFCGLPMYRYRFSGSARQLFFVVSEAILLIIPLLIILTFTVLPALNYFMPEFFRNMQDLITGKKVVGTIPLSPSDVNRFFVNFLGHVCLAGIPEETLKYICIKRVLYSSRAADASSVVLYGFGAGFGFAFGENIKYYLDAYVAPSGSAVGAMMQFSSRTALFPVHCCAAVFTAANLAKAKFLGVPCNYGRSIVEAVIFHALFNATMEWPLARLVILCVGYIFARVYVMRLDNVALVDFHTCVAEKKISVPKFCGKWTSPASEAQSFVYAPESTSIATDGVSVATTCSSCSETVMKHKILPSYCPYCLCPLVAREPDPEAPSAVAAALAGQSAVQPPRQSAPAPAAVKTRQVMVTVPQGSYPGQAIRFSTPDGVQAQVTIPAGMKPGMQFQVSL